MSEWMLWSRFGSSVQLGSAPPPRLYMISFSTSIEAEGPLAPDLGHRNRDERSLDGFTRAFDRAVSGEYDGVILPGSFLQHPLRNEVLARCANRKLRVVHQVTLDLYFANRSEISEALVDRLNAGDAVNFVFGGLLAPNLEFEAEFKKWPDQVYFTYSPRRSDDVSMVVAKLPVGILEKLFFHFPYHLEVADGRLSCRRVYELTIEIQKILPDFKVRPMLGTELYDPRVDPMLELEPRHGPEIELRSRDGADHLARVPLDVSVIIPSYNNRQYLLITLRHLLQQDLAASRFEIIVVDDGSNDGTRDSVRELASKLTGQFNFKYIFSPREKARKMGDANYRAGISRNLGVKNSNGRILCFLDSDILTPPNFLTDLLEKHTRYDVVQCKRLNLTLEKSHPGIKYENVTPGFDTFLTEDGYWEKFYGLTDWGAHPFFWKYTCTYGLSVSASLFKRVGWIRRGFVFYGFEDVEFGYRLAKARARFHLNSIITYHLFHRDDRSEFHNSDYLRQSLLAKTAQIFYLGNLEPEIFRHFRGSMKEQLAFDEIAKKILNRLGLTKLAEHVVRLKAPALALWNWRISAWHLKNRVIDVLPAGPKLPSVPKLPKLPSIQLPVPAVRLRLRHHIPNLPLWRAVVWWDRVWGRRWMLGTATVRVIGAMKRRLFQASYPLRKIYYFSAYQWNKRVGSKRLETRDSS